MHYFCPRILPQRFGVMLPKAKRMSKVLNFFKDWALPISIVTGIVSYLVFDALGPQQDIRTLAGRVVGILQPALLFCMLFLSFSRIDPRQAKFKPWHIWLLLIQAGSFIALALAILLCRCSGAVRVLIESAMLCMICPTATAAVVITDKLGGDTAGTVMYTMMINVTTAFVASVFIPMLNPSSDITFLKAFGVMTAKVFSLLVMPLVLAMAVRYLLPKVNRAVCKPKDLAFYIWTISLALALTVTTRSIVHTDVAWYFIVIIGVISLLCCILQFGLGHKIGSRYNDRITCGQSFGQKNTVFLIWMGSTFLDPVTAVVGGLYSIWHNIINSRQLYLKKKEGQK